MSKEANDVGEGGMILKDIVDPGEADVLCGRGGAALRHPGNQTYRRLVHLNKGLYITCLKAEKLKISRSIVAAIREQKGRFLERDTTKNTWFDIGDKKAMEKTSQALREGQPKLRQKIAELGGGATGAAALLESQFPTGLYNNMNGSAAADALSQRQKIQQMQQQQQLQQQAQMQHRALLEANAAMAPPAPPIHDMSPNIRSPNIRSGRLTDTAINEEFPGLNNLFRKTSINTDVQSVDVKSQLSLMSDYSNFGNSIGTISVPSAPSYAATPNTLASAGSNTGSNTGRLDRRKYFASIKYSGNQTAKSRSTVGVGSERSKISNNSRQLYASNRSMDGMPDIHLVESNPSLYSNISNPKISKEVNNSDLNQIFESRRSMMSGDRISTVDGASENSIFSDLSGKIGNVSTRSMAMSEFSDMGSKRITTSTRSMAMSEISGMDDDIPPLYDFDNYATPASGDGNMDF